MQQREGKNRVSGNLVATFRGGTLPRVDALMRRLNANSLSASARVDIETSLTDGAPTSSNNLIMRATSLLVRLGLVAVVFFASSASAADGQPHIAKLKDAIAADLKPFAEKYDQGLAALFERFKNSARLSEAILARDLRRNFETNQTVMKSDIVSRPEEIQQLQQDFIQAKTRITQDLVSRWLSEQRTVSTALLERNNLEEAAALERMVAEVKRTFEYTEVAEVRAGGATLPKRIRVTREHSMQVNVLGQLNTNVRLLPGESYGIEGVLGSDLIIMVGTNRVSIPIAKTDFPLRVERLAKGLQEDPSEEESLALARSENESPSESTEDSRSKTGRKNWTQLLDFRGAYANEAGGGIQLGRRAGLTLDGSHPRRVRVSVLVKFNQSDALGIVSRSNLQRWGGYGEFYGVGAKLNQRGNVVSLQVLAPANRMLAQAPYTFNPDQTYRVELQDDGNNVRLYINGRMIIQGQASERFGDRACVFSHESGSSLIQDFGVRAF